MALPLCPSLSMPLQKYWWIAQLRRLALHSVCPIRAVIFSELDPNELLSVMV